MKLKNKGIIDIIGMDFAAKQDNFAILHMEYDPVSKIMFFKGMK